MRPSAVDEFVSADSILIFKSGDQDYRIVTGSDFLDWIKSVYSPTKPVSQYSVPATGFTLAISDLGSDIHLMITPAGTLATGTLTLPPAANLKDGQVVIVSSSQTITALTIALNGATSSVGLPTTIAAGGYFEIKYDLPSKTWWRVG